MTDATAGQATKQALSHIRVLDLSRVFAGPWAGQMLADLGAEVIKVERPGRGDDARRLGPPFLRDDRGEETLDTGFFLSANRNKKSVTLDITKPEGQALIRKMVQSCDILIENYKVGDLRRYGLDYESLSPLNPRLIYCSITGFGQTGPYRSLPGYDSIFQGMGGLMSITGTPDDQPGGGPQKVGLIVADLVTGMYASVAMLAALEHRDVVSGKGQYIDLALLDSQIASLSHSAVGYLVSGTVPKRMGSVAPTGSPSQMFHCEDAPIMLVVGNDPQFGRLTKELGVPELASDPRFVTNRLRIQNRSELNAIIEPIFRSKSKRHWIEALGKATVPCGPVNQLNEVFEEPQVKAREMVITMHHPKRQTMPLLANPIKFSETPIQYRSAPPALGEHTDQVLRELLGVDSLQLAQLREKSVI
jgi:crotonobetainyl-CoA:carnitine CoA-transferase CaiB-like acyl-CoA transferase